MRSALILGCLTAIALLALPRAAAADRLCHPGFHTRSDKVTCIKEAAPAANGAGLVFQGKDQGLGVRVMRGDVPPRQSGTVHPLHNQARTFVKPHPDLIRHDHPARCILGSTGILLCFGVFPPPSPGFFVRDQRFMERPSFPEGQRLLARPRERDRPLFTRDGFTIEEIPPPLFRLRQPFFSHRHYHSFPGLDRHAFPKRQERIPFRSQNRQPQDRPTNYLAPPFSRFDQ